jgi:hypothetical protein
MAGQFYRARHRPDWLLALTRAELEVEHVGLFRLER